MRTATVLLLAAMVFTGAIACFGSGNGTPTAQEQSPDINATITDGIATAVARELGATEATAPTQEYPATNPVSSNGQTNWLAGLSQFRRIKVARDEVYCVGYDSGRYNSWSHPVIRIDDGFYALGNPGEAVVFYDNGSGCRIGVITDESME